MLFLIGMILSGIAVAILSLAPIPGIALLFISKPIVDTTFGETLFFGIHLTEVVAVLTPLLIIGKMLFAGEEEGLGRMPLKGIWILYAAEVGFFSLFIAHNQGLLAGANVFFRHINGFVGFYMLQAFFRQEEEKSLKLLLSAMMIAGLFPMGIGVYQLLTGQVWISGQAEGITRYVGLYHDAFTVRAYAFQTLFAALLYAALYGGEKFLIKCAALIYAAVSVVVMYRAYSKAGLISLALWTAAWTGLQRKIGTLIAIGVAGFLAGVYYASALVEQVTQLFHKEIGALDGKVQVARTFAGRWYGWHEMVDRWYQFSLVQKIFGSGETAFGSHNDYLQILFHGGVIGLLVYILLLGAIGIRIVKNLWNRVDPLGVGALMLFLMWLVDTIGLVPSAYPGYQWFVWGMIGLSLRFRQDEKDPLTEEEEPPVTANSIVRPRPRLSPAG